MKSAAFAVTIPPVRHYDEIVVALSDGYPAYARLWHPPPHGPPGATRQRAGGLRGAVLYQHGIQSHCGWYETSPARLAEAGFAVLQVDRRGSGRNERDRGHAESAEQLIADATAARDELFRHTGLNEYHVVGVSWGGKLAVAAHAAEPIGVKSLSLVTPGLFPRIGVSKERATQIGFAMLYEPHRAFDIPLNEPELFTADPNWQEFFRTDPLTLRRCTAGFYLASRRMDRLAAKLPEARPVPIHLFLAGDERIVDNEKTTAFIKKLGWPGSRITTHETARHSLEFEACSKVFLQELVSFVEDVSRSAP